ncbi:H-NS histone family protein [Aromatoleum petrolei]|uniref:H-NS histone family protein n=2 Tax=Aromatoleum petrolei TaxID=76116 RepID=A0ABX1MQ44_9RHOO|nr:H-NS histone family protein [Aromatoleum petrolei]QTQ38906.1 DNA-binding protein, H-NS histone family [Aromatoleum petrolei]
MTQNLRRYTLPQLKQLSARIAKEITRQESAGKASMLKQIQKMAREHGLSLDELVGPSGKIQTKPATAPTKAIPATRAPLPAKYRHPSNKELAWSGRGRRPLWVEAWLANDGAMEALATATQKFGQRQAKLEAPVESRPRANAAVPAAGARTDAPTPVEYAPDTLSAQRDASL